MSRADDDDEYDDRRRRRRPRDDDEYDDRPRRGKAGGGISPWVIVGVVVGGMFCCIPVGIALLLPAVQKVRQAAARAKDMNNYKQVALGVVNYQDANRHLPPADGGLSWRVHLLPYVDEQNLHARFDATQPWDGPRNRPLADTRVPTYTSPLDAPEAAPTRMRVFTGPDTLFPPGDRPLRLPADVKDGAGNTFLVVESGDAAPWPQPRELEFSPTGPLPPLGHPQRPGVFLVAMADGSVRPVNTTATPAAIRAAVTPAAGDGPPDL